MTTFVLNTTYSWSYNGSGKWGFYSTWNATSVGSDEVWMERNGIPTDVISFHGTNLKWTNHSFSGGIVTGLTVSETAYDVYITDASVNAKTLDKLMKDGSASASAKIFAAFFAGDDDVTLGFGNDRMATFGGDDVVYGRAGNDTINAGSGHDTIYGGTGNDYLTGGSGRDYFVFDTKASSRNIDTISDFSVKDDTIIIDHLIYRGVGKSGDLASSAFWSNTTGKAHDTTDRIIYNSKTGGLFFDADGTGSGTAVQFAKLDAGLKLTAADFDLI